MKLLSRVSVFPYSSALLIAALMVAPEPAKANPQNTGFIEICKVSTTVAFNTGFTFTISPNPTNTSPTQIVGAGNPTALCSAPIQVPAGTVTVTEAIPTNIALVNVTATTGSGTTVPVTSVGNPQNGVSFQLAAGDSSHQVIITFKNEVIPTAVIEVCKQAAPGTTLTGNFTFDIAGGTPAKAVVEPGLCSGNITVPAGNVTVTEEINMGAVMTGASAISFQNGAPGVSIPVTVNPNLQSATFNVGPGNVSQQTIVTFVDKPVLGELKICKIAGSGVMIGQVFAISANGTPYNVPAGVTGTNTNEECVIDGTFNVGSMVTVSESVPTGGAATITSTTQNGTLANCSAGTTTCSAQVLIGSGITEVFVTNTVPVQATGQLKVCKAAGPGVTGLTFTITVTGPTGAKQTFPVVGGGCALDGTFPVGTMVTVAETIPSGFTVTSIGVVSSSGTTTLPNPSSGTGTVTIGTGVTEVTFTNAATATIRACKVVGSPNLVNTTFPISVSRGGTTTGSASLTPTSLSTQTCSQVSGSYLAGQTVTVSEPTQPSGVVSTVSVNGGAATTATSATFQLAAGANMVVFTNTQFSTLQICKIGVGATVGRSFSFTITGGSSVTTPISITAGYPAANCKTVSGTFLTGSQVGVSEAAQSNTSTTVSVNGGTATSGTSATFNLASGLNTVTFTNKIAKAQGCSPGFFKNHPGAFTPPYTPSTKVGLVFTAAFGDLRSETLEDALQGGGGPGLLGAEKILLRAAVAALLNAANPNISYPLATAQVIAQVNAALAGNNRQTMLNLASQLDIDNNLGCPIGGDNGSDS